MLRNVMRWVRLASIWLAALGSVLAVSWFAPSLANASVNMLFRLRGELKPAGDIVIVGIDDASLQRVGQYPWARHITADCLNKITAGNPRAVGVDIIYAEESTPEDDKALAAALRAGGRTVLPVQLFESTPPGRPQTIENLWLRPLPPLEKASAAQGHAHAAPDTDGTLRTIQLAKADDEGRKYWAFGIEVLRVADNLAPAEIQENPGGLKLGPHQVTILPPDEEDAPPPGVEVIRPDEMLINYAGPARTFVYYSFADVLSGAVPPQTFKNKIVLLGAVSPTLGDVQVTPFMHFSSANEREGGQGMPGVEVHANVINTIENNLSLSFPTWIADIAALLLIVFAATAAVIFLDGWKQVVILLALLFSIIGGSLTLFNYWHVIPSLPEMLTAFFTSVPLLLLDKSLAASRDLDVKLGTLAEAQKGFLSDDEGAEPRWRSAVVPHNLEWKLRAVDDITGRVLARMSFINRVLTGMTEGVIVTDTAGRVVFVNDRFAEISAAPTVEINNKSLAFVLGELSLTPPFDPDALIKRALGGEIIELELETAKSGRRFFFVRISRVTSGGEELQAEADALGILILFSDVTKQRELDRLKAETLQLVSHELRSPLTSIQGLSDVLLKFPVEKDESTNMLATINSEAIRLNKLIDRFLDIRRLESGARDLNLGPVNVKELIDRCLNSARAAAREKGIRIETISASDSKISVNADGQLLEQAVGNLLNNAVKYSPPDSVVEAGTAADAKEIRISISDRGPGIPGASAAQIFDKFYRLKRDAASSVPGTGLGLAFVKEIAEKHGGSVAVRSREGGGSEFILRLPR
jgi:signal transduction histidine kinase/CHASE2 domain-containing sensor protein